MISLEFFKYKWYNTIYACVAQPVVQLIRNEQVAGSNPVTSSIAKAPQIRHLRCLRCFFVLSEFYFHWLKSRKITQHYEKVGVVIGVNYCAFLPDI